MLTFNEKGLLPPRDYNFTFSELRQSILVEGHANSDDWDKLWRIHLVDNLEIMVGQLWTIGITEIFINGSFVQDKAHPNDIDGYFVCDLKYFASGQLHSDLNLLDPNKIWTWDPRSRRPYRGSTKRQLPMWHEYRVELYPHYNQSSGILDKHGNEMQFPSAFRVERYTYEPKGIVKIIK